MDHLRRANLLEVVNRVHQKVQEINSNGSTNEDQNSPETPIDYSMMSRKRRLLTTYDESNTGAKRLDYGSDGHSDRSSSGSPIEASPDSGSGSPSNNSLNSSNKDPSMSPEMDSSLHHHSRLREMQLVHSNPESQQAAALSLFLQAQQQQQHHTGILQPFYRLSSIGQQPASHTPVWQSDSIAVSPPPLAPPPSTPTGTTSATLELARATHESQQKFAEFRHNLLRQIETSRSLTKDRRSTSPSPMTSPPPSSELGTPSTPSTSGSSSMEKDTAYWERRRKNNEAAKRSRDARRAKEQEIALRAQFLEQENIQLKLELAHLRAENAQIIGQFRQMQSAGKMQN